jgi:hypothetical protein
MPLSGPKACITPCDLRLQAGTPLPVGRAVPRRLAGERAGRHAAPRAEGGPAHSPWRRYRGDVPSPAGRDCGEATRQGQGAKPLPARRAGGRRFAGPSAPGDARTRAEGGARCIWLPAPGRLCGGAEGSGDRSIPPRKAQRANGSWIWEASRAEAAKRGMSGRRKRSPPPQGWPTGRAPPGRRLRASLAGPLY